MCEGPGHSTKKKHETNSGAFLQLNQVSIFSLNIGEKKFIVAHLNHFETQNKGLY